MNKRIIIKTVLVCMGLFISISSIAAVLFLQHYQFDTERKYQVLVALTNIEQGTVINESMVGIKTIKESALNEYMLKSADFIKDKKALSKICQGDYIRDYELLPRDKWTGERDRIIAIPLETKEKFVNFIQKGSLVDIRVFLKDDKTAPKVVLSRIKVEDILDEGGLSIEQSVANKKMFAKVVLDDEKRNKIYIASRYGELIYELYCDHTQKPQKEDFKVPVKKPAILTAKEGGQ